MANLHNLRIVFMGTPDFAVASLQKLLEAGCQIVGVITAPDKPAGRGMQLQASAVKQFALEKGLTVLQPEKLKHPDFIQQLAALQADLQIVVAFRMLPEIVWNMPRLGTINVHGSLLPQYRGAAPINWAIINGEAMTGVTTFKLLHAIDTGHILLQEKIMIGPNDDAGVLHDRMKKIGAALLLKTIEQLADGSLEEKPQESLATGMTLKHAPKLFTETCAIDWNSSCQAIHNLVRGLSPFPGAFTFIHGKRCKIYRIRPETDSLSVIPGTIETDKKTYVRIAATTGWVYLHDIQVEGKRKMSIVDFLRGNPTIPSRVD
jgi:methionyl-tRNA formyltransferase